MCVMLLQSCVILSDPIDCSPPSSSVHGILQVRILEWFAISSSRGSPQPGKEPVSLMSLTLAGGFFTTSATWEASILSVTPRKIIAPGKLDPSQAPGFQHQQGPAEIPGVPSSGACRASAPLPLSMVPKFSLLSNAARSPRFTCKAAANLFLLNLPPSCP